MPHFTHTIAPNTTAAAAAVTTAARGGRLLALALLGGLVFASAQSGALPGTDSAPAQAEDCTQFVTHWGRIRPRRDAAVDMARAGLDWKVRNKLRGQYAGTSRVLQCKRRSGRGWQCQVGARVNRCA